MEQYSPYHHRVYNTVWHVFLFEPITAALSYLSSFTQGRQMYNSGFGMVFISLYIQLFETSVQPLQSRRTNVESPGTSQEPGCHAWHSDTKPNILANIGRLHDLTLTNTVHPFGIFSLTFICIIWSGLHRSEENRNDPINNNQPWLQKLSLLGRTGRVGGHSPIITPAGFLIFCRNSKSPTFFSLFLCCKSVIIAFKSKSHYLTECTLLKLANSKAHDESKYFISFVLKF